VNNAKFTYYTISHRFRVLQIIGQIFVFLTVGAPLFNTLVRSELLKAGIRNSTRN